MKRAAIVVGLAVGLVGAPPAEACPNSYGGDVVVARNMTCSEARDVVRTWAVRHQRDGKYNRLVLGFRCRVETLPHEGYRVTCRRGEKEVGFYPNVPDVIPCGSFRKAMGGGTSYTIKVRKKGHVPCRSAMGMVKDFWFRRGLVQHGGPYSYNTYYTLKRFPGWRCGTGAGGGACTHSSRGRVAWVIPPPR